MKYNLTYIIFFLFSLNLSAQSYEMGVFAGYTFYQGDLADGALLFKNLQPAGGLLLRYNPKRYFSMRVGFTTGKLLGDDKDSKNPARRARGYSFYSVVREISGIAELHLPYYGHSSYGLFRLKMSPFIFGGVALTVINGEPKAPADLVPYPFPEFDAKKNFFVLPMGGGFKFLITEQFAISGEWGARKTFGDYIDGIKREGNPKSSDWYTFGGLTFTYVVDGGDRNPYRGRK